MYDFFQNGDEVIYQDLSDMILIVEGINESNDGIRCKYFDDNLKRYIRLILPAESLTPHRSQSRLRKIYK